VDVLPTGEKLLVRLDGGQHTQIAGNPFSSTVPSCLREGGSEPDVNFRGRSKPVEPEDNPQPSHLDVSRWKVQRLDGCGPNDALASSGLRYSPTRAERPVLPAHVVYMYAPLRPGTPQNGSLRLNLTQHGETHQVQTTLGLTD
jgi:hypothetical protein